MGFLSYMLSYTVFEFISTFYRARELILLELFRLTRNGVVRKLELALAQDYGPAHQRIPT